MCLLLVTTIKKNALMGTYSSGLWKVRKKHLLSTNVLGWVLGEESKLGSQEANIKRSVLLSLF